MRSAVTMAALFLVASLAGCASDEAVPVQVADPDVPDVGEGSANETIEWVVDSIDVEFQGHLGTQVSMCEWAVYNDCAPIDPVVEDETDHYVERPGARVTAVDLVLTWETNPAFDDLGLGAMRMGANDTDIGLVYGDSPLTLNVTDLDMMLDDENLLHVYVYNHKGSQRLSPTSVYVYAAADISYKIVGTVTIEEPAA